MKNLENKLKKYSFVVEGNLSDNTRIKNSGTLFAYSSKDADTVLRQTEFGYTEDGITEYIEEPDTMYTEEIQMTIDLHDDIPPSRGIWEYEIKKRFINRKLK